MTKKYNVPCFTAEDIMAWPENTKFEWLGHDKGFMPIVPDEAKAETQITYTGAEAKWAILEEDKDIAPLSLIPSKKKVKDRYQKRKWMLSMEQPPAPKLQVSEILLESFAEYCGNHPEERFWQALRNWSKRKIIQADGQDTFFWEGRYGMKKKELPPMYRHKVKHDIAYVRREDRDADAKPE